MAVLRAAPVGHADETSSKVAGQRQWVHVVGTAALTHYARHAKRGHAATAASGLLPGFTGRLIHDGWAAYWHHPGAHGRCNAHHLRALTALAEQPGQGWAADLHALLRLLLRQVHQGRAVGQVASPPAACAALVARAGGCGRPRRGAASWRRDSRGRIIATPPRAALCMSVGDCGGRGDWAEFPQRLTGTFFRWYNEREAPRPGDDFPARCRSFRASGFGDRKLVVLRKRWASSRKADDSCPIAQVCLIG